MRNPFRRDEFIPSTTKDGGCKAAAIGGTLVVLGILVSLGGLAFYGAVEFLARV